ncbi:MAG: hypothetical protein J0H88_11085 [Sphingomonadales bacterium]|nr:hypothetical protein [Sphingomonadales bacterium]
MIFDEGMIFADARAARGHGDRQRSQIELVRALQQGIVMPEEQRRIVNQMFAHQRFEPASGRAAERERLSKRVGLDARYAVTVVPDGNPEMVKIVLDRGADFVRARPQSDDSVESGSIACGGK